MDISNKMSQIRKQISTYESEIVQFYDFKISNHEWTLKTSDLNLEDPKISYLKYDILTFYMFSEPSILKAEIKVVTYVDLFT